MPFTEPGAMATPAAPRPRRICLISRPKEWPNDDGRGIQFSVDFVAARCHRWSARLGRQNTVVDLFPGEVFNQIELGACQVPTCLLLHRLPIGKSCRLKGGYEWPD
jgi:hypothetical protein